MKRSVTGAGVLLAFALPLPAGAGTYEVISCADAPGRVNNAWTLENTHPEVIATGALATCPPSGGLSGLWASDDLAHPGDAPDGARAEYAFDAPPGTSIGAWRYNRWLGKQITNSWDIYAKQTGPAGETVLDSCRVPGDGDPCERGAPGGVPAGDAAAFGLTASRLSVGFRCAAGGFLCDTGSTIHLVWAALYSSRVTLVDPSPPALSQATGSLAGDGTVRGTASLAFGASDDTGIAELRVLVNGDTRAAAVRACDYTFPVPCPPGAAAAFEVDTTLIPDGTYPVEIAAIDATAGRPGENLARRRVATITIDNVPEPDPLPPLPAPSDPPAPPAVLPPAPGPGEDPAAPVPRAERLSITSVRRRGANLLVSGRVPPRSAGALTVSFRPARASATGPRALLRRRTRPRGGRFSVRLRPGRGAMRSGGIVTAVLSPVAGPAPRRVRRRLARAPRKAPVRPPSPSGAAPAAR